jgi:hypothetical protein
MVLYERDRDHYVVVGSNTGSERAPAKRPPAETGAPAPSASRRLIGQFVETMSEA